MSVYTDRLQQLRGAPLTEEELAEIDLWEKGRALRQIVLTDGWEIAMETLRGFPRDLTEQLLSINPAEKDRVLAAHAAAYGVCEAVRLFEQGIKAAIEASEKLPDVIKAGAKQIKSEVPPELS